MGRDKALLEIGGVPLVIRTARLIQPLVGEFTVIGPPERYTPHGLEVVPDHFENVGPLGGIATALRISRREWNVILGCDLPYLTASWLEWLIARALRSRADAVLPETSRGLEPLCALYRSSVAPVVAAAVARGVRKVTDGLADFTVETTPEREWSSIASGEVLFRNVNTPQDFEKVRIELESKNSG
jgi:molybdenum cofactor guanylyltransferase